MKSVVKKFLIATPGFLIWILSGYRVGLYFFDHFLRDLMNRVREVTHDGDKMNFAAPNALSDWRAQTFSSIKSETLRWIGLIPEGAVLWDVGANVGLYSVYAAKKRNGRVCSFELSVFNLELLARDISLNGLTEKACMIPLALSDRSGTSTMCMTTPEWSGTLSTFDKDFGGMERKFNRCSSSRPLA